MVCNRPAVLEIAHKDKSVHVTLVHRALRRQIIPVCLDTENLSVSINKTYPFPPSPPRLPTSPIHYHTKV